MEVATRAVSPVWERVAAAVSDHVPRDRQLRRNLPGEGRLHLDRGLPFLLCYRRPPGREDAGTSELVTALSAYLVAPGDERFHAGLREVVGSLARAARGRRGGFLLVELWAAEVGVGRDGRVPPTARVFADDARTAVWAEALVGALEAMRLRPANGGALGAPDRLTRVEVAAGTTDWPPDLAPLLDPAESGLYRMGLELAPFYRGPGTGSPYPRVVQALRMSLAEALGEALFRFCEEETSLDPPHPRALGRTHAGRAAFHVDRRIGEVAASFDTLLQVTPVNTEEAWAAFDEGRRERAPELRYRPLPFDPESAKRRLFHVPIERIEDPLLGYLFREKQEELDREITLVRDLGTPRFLHASAELHGTPDPHLVTLAGEMLARLPPPGSVGQREEYAEEDEARVDRGRYVDAAEFAERAEREIDRYRAIAPDFAATVEVRPDVAAGVMVSRGVLCVSEGLHLPRERVDALLAHEVGTHLVTWVNGSAQPLRIFQSGLAGYDPLQEGLAVLAEYIVGGLTVARARVLAARVLAVESVLDGAGFVDTFRLLAREHGFRGRTAFVVALRVHRGGGLTKDAAYLRGLRNLLAHLAGGGELDVLLVGKLGLSHADVVQELVLRGVLTLPVVKPLYATDPGARRKLERCRRMDVLDLVEEIRS